MHWCLMYNDASHDDIGVLGRLFEEWENLKSFRMYNAHGNAPEILYLIPVRLRNICTLNSQCFGGHCIEVPWKEWNFDPSEW